MSNKDRAVDFLQLVIAGEIDKAYQTYMNFDGRHHNMYTPAGFANLLKGMQIAEEQTPNKEFEIKNVFGDGGSVAVHSHLKVNPDEPGMVTVHMFRFEEGKIVELWDIAQAIPSEEINSDGAF